MPGAYYNEIDPFAAQWLRNLITAGHIAPGDVDERSIVDIRPDELAGYTQCHFFAGIGGWSHALRLAGWPDDRPVWSGSPPCQDHSVAGHIWGVHRGLDGPRGQLARPWLDLVCGGPAGIVLFENVPGIEGAAYSEIERCLASAGFRISKSKSTSAGVGAPHLRRRVWAIADRYGARLEEPRPPRSRPALRDPRGAAPGNVWVASARRSCGLDDGFPRRVDAVRAFGNAIDPWAAAEFIGAYLDGEDGVAA